MYGAGVGFSGIFNEPLSLRVKQGVVTAVGVFVDIKKADLLFTSNKSALAAFSIF